MKFSIVSFYSSSCADSSQRHSIRQKKFFFSVFVLTGISKFWPQPTRSRIFCTFLFCREAERENWINISDHHEARLTKKIGKQNFIWLIHRLKNCHTDRARHFLSKLPPRTAPHSPFSVSLVGEKFFGKENDGQIRKFAPSPHSQAHQKNFSLLSTSDGKESHQRNCFYNFPLSVWQRKVSRQKKGRPSRICQKSRLAKKVISRPDKKLSNVSPKKIISGVYRLDNTCFSFLLLPGPKNFSFPSKGGKTNAHHTLSRLHHHLSQMTSTGSGKVFLVSGNKKELTVIYSFSLPPVPKNVMMLSDPLQELIRANEIPKLGFSEFQRDFRQIFLSIRWWH